jgi:hypothetical protein
MAEQEDQGRHHDDAPAHPEETGEQSRQDAGEQKSGQIEEGHWEVASGE